jgi:multiple sugar transport system permease protein
VTYSRASPAFTRAVLTAVMWLVGLIYLVPLIWMAAVSLKTPEGAAAPGVGLLPAFNRDGSEIAKSDRAYWSALGDQAAANYRDVWNNPVSDFPLYLHNSLWVALLSVAGMVVSSAVVAYGFARIRWRGRDGVFLCVLATLMIPQAVVMAPLYIVFKHLGWIGSFKPLWLPAWFGGAFSIFMLRQFFLTIPRELDEAARIDGCSHFGIFTRIILPLSKPALAAVAVLHFAAVWNDFLGPLLFLNHQDQYTLAIGLHMFHTQHGGTPWNLVMAFSLMVVAPVLVVYALGRRFFVEGVGTQGLKE